MKRTTILIICLIVALVACAAALYVSHKQQKELEAQNEELQQIAAQNSMYGVVGQGVVGLIATIASIF
jgi:flagellar basal body-associated protein FliL